MSPCPGSAPAERGLRASDVGRLSASPPPYRQTVTLAEEVKRGILLRLDALEGQVRDLRGSLGESRPSLSKALHLFEVFPAAARTVTEAEWNDAPDDATKVLSLRPIQRHVLAVGTFVEDWLSHGDRMDLSLNLHEAIRHECLRLSIPRRNIVVANGPANNFFTRPGDIKDALFGPLGPHAPSLPVDLQNETFAFMQVPRLHGASAIARPVVVGHETAHLAIEEHGSIEPAKLAGALVWPPPAGSPPVRIPSSITRLTGSEHLSLLRVLASWCKELICDIYAVRRFGAAGAAALSEFFFAIGASDTHGPTHPSGGLRIRLMLDLIGTQVDPGLADLVSPWETEFSTVPSTGEPWVDYLSAIAYGLRTELEAVVDSWGVPAYDSNTRRAVITALAGLFTEGIPGDYVVDTPSGRIAVTDADVVNAYWVCRCQADLGERTELLAGKCLEDTDFVVRWLHAGGAVPTRIPPSPAPAEPTGTLSTTQIEHRLWGSHPRPLVVTPALPDAIQGVGMDLRLGNQFIVFARSRTTSFDPLSDHGNPRSIQRIAQLDWTEKFVLHPTELVLAATLEYLVLPEDLNAQVITRSSYGRLGLLSATAVQVHPHFSGCLTLELVNLGTLPLELTPGERLAQLVLSTCEPVPPPEQAKYRCAVGPQFSSVRSDAEADVLRRLRTARPSTT